MARCKTVPEKLRLLLDSVTTGRSSDAPSGSGAGGQLRRACPERWVPEHAPAQTAAVQPACSPVQLSRELLPCRLYLFRKVSSAATIKGDPPTEFQWLFSLQLSSYRRLGGGRPIS